MHVDEVDVIHVQSFHALIDALRGALARVVPCVHAVLAVASHFRAEEILVSWDALERQTQHGLSLVVTVVGTYVDEVDASLDGSFHRLNAFGLLRGVEHAAQR